MSTDLSAKVALIVLSFYTAFLWNEISSSFLSSEAFTLSVDFGSSIFFFLSLFKMFDNSTYSAFDKFLVDISCKILYSSLTTSP